MPPIRAVRDPVRYKTTHGDKGWNNPDNCPYGWRCEHARHLDELRTPPAPPPSTVQSPVAVVVETRIPSNLQLSETPSNSQLSETIVRPLLPGPPPPLPKATAIEDNETLDYLDAVLAAMRSHD